MTDAESLAWNFIPGLCHLKELIANRIQMNTIKHAIEIEMTAEFAQWLHGLADRPTRVRLLRRLERASQGLLGDVRPVGGPVFEMREFFGPGLRLYYIHKGKRVLFFLCGGNKGSQSADIAKARLMAEKLLLEMNHE